MTEASSHPVDHGAGAVRRSRDTMAFAIATGLSAYLLFMVQPLVGRLVLPSLGGSAAVWTTCLLFFQAALLTGYAWAHVQSLLPQGLQRVAHLAVLAVGLVSLPLGISGWHPPSEGFPVGWLVALLATSCGLPVFALASNAATLQRWYARATGRSPYALYAVSNAASLFGLLSYPLVWEPVSTLTTQRSAWSVVYVLEVAAVAACALVVRGIGSSGATRDVTPRPGWRDIIRWVVLASIPASLVAGVTAHITSDLAPVPLLWVIPLALYLLTFITSFAGWTLTTGSAWARALPVVIVPLIALEVSRGAPTWAVLCLHLATFTTIAALCHGRLWATRPAADHLTAYYLWIAIGGVTGGFLNAVLAPLLFTGTSEYPLVLLAGSAVIAGMLRHGDRGTRVATAAVVVSGLGWLAFGHASNPTVAIAPVAVFLAFQSLRRPALRVAASIVVVVLFGKVVLAERRQHSFAARSFYAALRVVEDFRPGVRALVHGATIHGLQSTDPVLRRSALSYFTTKGPVGQLIAALGPRLDNARVGVIGLGVGELATHARAGQAWTFFEIDPLVRRIATNPQWFTYLSQAPASMAIVLGDARVSLEDSRDRYRLLVIDAFSSDVIPMHLLTREALAIYLDHLEKHGVIAFHVSNRFAELEPVVGALALDAGLDALARFDPAEVERGAAPDRMPSRWVVIARHGDIPYSLDADAGWRRPAVPRRARPWTDERSDVLSAVWRWSR